MMPATIHELFAHNDWARDRLMSCAIGLDDQALDRGFEMGLGTLRHTLHHLWAAERVWLDRWIDATRARFVEFEPGLPLATLHERWRATAAERNAFLAGIGSTERDRNVAYTNSRGEAYCFPLLRLTLHVCTHGIHHRAQAINMLRRLGAALKPGGDYIFMKVEQQDAAARLSIDAEHAPVSDGDAAAIGPDLPTLRAFYAYADWARDRSHAAAESLTDEQLDRPFEMGMGTLRKTLLHVHDAERWWLDAWRNGPGQPFPQSSPATPIAELRARFAETAQARAAMLDRMTEADLMQIVAATPRPGVLRRFPIGVTMLQLCCHGTHHRAQALNMLRHVGGVTPALDFLAMLNEQKT